MECNFKRDRRHMFLSAHRIVENIFIFLFSHFSHFYKSVMGSCLSTSQKQERNARLMQRHVELLQQEMQKDINNMWKPDAPIGSVKWHYEQQEAMNNVMKMHHD